MNTGKALTAAILAATTSFVSVNNAAANNKAANDGALQQKVAESARIDADGFVAKASAANLFEIESGKIAVEKSAHPEVKEYAQGLINDHLKSNAALKSAVPAAGVKEESFVKMMEPKQQKLLESLKNASRADFDRQYLKAQADAHKEAIALYTDYAANGDNARLREFATQSLPALKAHKDEAMGVEEVKQSGQAAH